MLHISLLMSVLNVLPEFLLTEVDIVSSSSGRLTLQSSMWAHALCFTGFPLTRSSALILVGPEFQELSALYFKIRH